MSRRSVLCSLSASVLLVAGSVATTVDAGWNESDPSTSEADRSMYHAVSALPSGGALAVGEYTGSYEGLSENDGFDAFVQYRDPAGEIAWTEALPGPACESFGEGARDRAEPTTAYFVIDNCNGRLLVSADESGVVATQRIDLPDEFDSNCCGVGFASFAASPTGGVHVVALEPVLTMVDSERWMLFVLDRDLTVQHALPVPANLTTVDPSSGDVALSNLVSSSGAAWVVGLDPKVVDPADVTALDDDTLVLAKLSTTGGSDTIVEARADECFSFDAARRVRALQTLDEHLWVWSCEENPNAVDGFPHVFVEVFDDVTGTILGRVPLPDDLISASPLGVEFSNDGRLASSGSYTGEVIWRIEGDLSDTTWDVVALSDSFQLGANATWTPAFDRMNEQEYVAVGAFAPDSLVDEFGSALERAAIVRRELPVTTAVDPARLLETRTGMQTVDDVSAAIGRLVAGSTTPLRIAGRAGVRDDAAAVMVNVTAINPSTKGFVTLYPCDAPRDETSALNFEAGVTTGNTVTSRLSVAGDVCVFTSAETDLAIDVSGFFRDAPQFGSIAPARLTDTRIGQATSDGQEQATGRIVAGSTRQVVVGGRSDIDDGADSVIVNVTAINPAATGFITLFPCDEAQPSTSSLNFVSGQTAGNQAIVRLSSAGTICAFSSSSTDLTIDATGWLGQGSGHRSGPALRFLDSRIDGETFDGRARGGGGYPANQVFDFPMGRNIDADGFGGYRTALLNVTVVKPQSNGFVTMWPCDDSERQPRPNAATVNFRSGENAGNTLLVRVPDFDGLVCLETTARADIIVDVVSAR